MGFIGFSGCTLEENSGEFADSNDNSNRIAHFSRGFTMQRYLICLALLFSAAWFPLALLRGDDEPAGLQVGFGEVDITPELGKKPVFMAGFGKNRKATAIHDPLMARAIVFGHDKAKVALVSVDVVGLFHAVNEQVRKQLPGF
jgi:hypothetical protein